jgi:glycosyltransferase involved in cell wall biosynthesis
MELFDCTIVIPVRNKASELQDSVQIYLRQDLGAVPFIIIDDASDNPADIERAVRGLSCCQLVRQNQRTGQAGARNVGLRMATTKFCLLMDDDSHVDNPADLSSFLRSPPENPTEALYRFETIRQDDGYRGGIPATAPAMAIDLFIGFGALMHRTRVLSAGAFRDFWMYRGEEEDLAIRLFRNGLQIRYTPGIRVIHRYQPYIRSAADVAEYEYLNVRNTLLFYFLNYPMPLGIIEGTTRALKSVLVAPRNRSDRVRGLYAGLSDCLRYARVRTPLSYRQLSDYRHFRRSVQRQLQKYE